MVICSVFLRLLFLSACGVFGDEVKSVSVTEGQNVTLHTDDVKQTDDKIVWTYGPENTFVARLNGKAIYINSSGDERFRDKVKLNNQTGDLIITHITSQHSGLYTLKISRNMKVSYKTFNLTVYSRLPVPALIRDSSQISSSSERSSSLKCSVLCSVMNVSHDVSVSWYKGKSLLSSISVSDLNIRLSLPLECLDDSDVYSCVINNSISTQTQHLNTDVCHKCSDSPNMRRNMRIIIPTVTSALLICVIIFIIIKHKRRVEVCEGSDQRLQQII